MASRRSMRGGGEPGSGARGTAGAERAAADGGVIDASTERDDKDAAHKTWPDPQDAAPAVGKTGGRGSRAERPSPVSERRQATRPLVEVTRTSKPPAETPKAKAGRGGPKAAAS